MVLTIAAAAAVAVGAVGTAALMLRRRRRLEPASTFALVQRRLAEQASSSPAPFVGQAIPPSGGEPDVWSTIAARIDPLQFRPRLARDVEVKIFRLRWGNDYAMVANPRALLHYRLEVWQAELLALMDGTRTLGEIVVERLEGSGDFDASGVADIVEALHEGGFLDPQPLDVTAAVTAAIHPAPRGTKLARQFAKTLMLEWTGADAFVRRCHRAGVRWFFVPVVAMGSAILAIAGFAAFLAVQHSGRYSLSDASAPVVSLILIGLALALTFAHELGHASVLIHFGRRIRSAGFMLYFGSPAFFVDASDGLMLDRGKRMVQASAGPFAELILSGVASLLLVAFPDSAMAPILYKFSLLNYFVIFLNLIPLLELDGYWLLCDLIQVPELRPRSLEFIQHDAWHKIRGGERFTKQELGLATYGIIGIVYTVLSIFTAVFFWREIFGGLVSALWRGGPLSRLLLIVLALFLAGPAIRGAIGLARAVVRRTRAIERRLRFRLETKWRIEAAEMIDSLPAFEDLPEDVLSDLAGRVALRPVRPGAPVFRQGDRATAFYVIRGGSVSVEEEHPDTGDVNVIRTLGRGESFGELGLLEAAPRTATIRAVDDVELFEVDKGTFDRLLADSAHTPEFGLTLQAMAELRDLPAFAGLSSGDLAELLERGRWVTPAPGEVLVEQGEAGDAFYAIRSGQADVVRDGATVKTLGAGDYFGEIALLQDVPRTASVVARTPMRAYRLDRDGFDGLIKQAFAKGTLRLSTGWTWQH